MGSWRWLTIALVVVGVASNAEDFAPAIDHHQHLLSPQGAALLNNPRTAVDIPAGVTQVLQQHEAAWNEPARLASVYSADAVVMDDDGEEWLRCRQALQRTETALRQFARRSAQRRSCPPHSRGVRGGESRPAADRILYGSDAAFGNHPDPGGSWVAFRKVIPLSPAEFEKIANNIAPYLH